jgi:hypothetical protein
VPPHPSLSPAQHPKPVDNDNNIIQIRIMQDKKKPEII